MINGINSTNGNLEIFKQKNVKEILPKPCYASTTDVREKENKFIVINGKSYPVKRVQDNNTLIKSILPMYKEVVVIDGKEYNVKTGPSIGIHDKQCEYVVVDGQRYNLKNGFEAGVECFVGNLLNKEV